MLLMGATKVARREEAADQVQGWQEQGLRQIQARYCCLSLQPAASLAPPFLIFDSAHVLILWVGNADWLEGDIRGLWWHHFEHALRDKLVEANCNSPPDQWLIHPGPTIECWDLWSPAK